jgi:hypothetical protein
LSWKAPGTRPIEHRVDPLCALAYAYYVDSNLEAKVQVKYEDDAGPSSITASIPEDFLIVSLGDSFASGEGNPDVPVQDLRPDDTSPRGVPIWMDIRCHRSAWAGPIQAGLRMAKERPAVTILSLACSGAQVEVGVMAQSDGIASDRRIHRQPPAARRHKPSSAALTSAVLAQNRGPAPVSRSAGPTRGKTLD